ncbi:MAG: response regulator [Spirochaetales bacterium]|nr:response regulator [Spirochaetales bacterium]
MENTVTKNRCHILLVEDNERDIILTKEAFKDNNMTYSLFVAKNGIEALSFLRREDGYENVPRPDIILLDLNMPGKSGFDVLKEIKSDRNYRSIPVAIFSNSSNEDDIMASYNDYANCFITKPVDYEQLITVIRIFFNFWVDTVKLPPHKK